MIKKNIVVINICLVLIAILGIGFSYSLWNISVSQNSISTISTDCFDLTISNKDNNISLDQAYPISNSKGMKLTPYTFTVANTCDITAEYSINLEVLKNSTLSSEFIDVMLDGNINLLSSYDKIDKVDNSSIESRKIDTGILKSNESKDYSLRLWIDYDTTMEDLNNETKVFKARVTIVGKPINYSGDTVFNFDYTGGEQIFTAPVSGTYKLETWGAQGGFSRNTEIIGGYGGYSTGTIKINYLEKININIGGVGIDGVDTSTNRIGGYNGGGNSYYFSHNNCYSGSGGGATHIASKSGLLSTLENYKNNILIVSGGGGGASGDYISNSPGSSFGGNGGGFKGTDSYNIVGAMNSGYGYGASQTSGGTFYKTTYTGQSGTFGKGADSTQGTNNGGSGAGGGFYGGGSGGGHYGSGGGSGYIGNPLLTDKVMYCYNCEESSEENTKTISTTCSEENPTSNCAKKGNGYARITLVSINE